MTPATLLSDQWFIRLFDHIRGIERIAYQRRGAWPNEVAITECPHGGAWNGRHEVLRIHKPGTWVPAKVGTNGCARCIFNAETDYDHVKCLFLLANQKKTDNLLRQVR